MSENICSGCMDGETDYLCRGCKSDKLYAEIQSLRDEVEGLELDLSTPDSEGCESCKDDYLSEQCGRCGRMIPCRLCHAPASQIEQKEK